MKQYLELLQDVLENGTSKGDRTGTGTLSLFGVQQRYNLTEGFPLVTTKKVFTKGIIAELLWFLKGNTNIKWLNEQGVHIWDEWANKDGELGPVYGEQWRSWTSVDYSSEFGAVFTDQIAEVIEQIKTNPDSRRLIVSAWNVGDISLMALPPCHLLFQFYVSNGKLSCHLYQRSGDCGLGIPFNIASYALLTHMIAQVCDLKVGDFVHTIGDAHIYLNHVPAIKEQLTREPRELSRLWLNPEVKDIDSFTMDDIKILNYNPHPSIKMDVAV